jgi:hypothetical protein
MFIEPPSPMKFSLGWEREINWKLQHIALLRAGFVWVRGSQLIL